MITQSGVYADVLGLIWLVSVWQLDVFRQQSWRIGRPSPSLAFKEVREAYSTLFVLWSPHGAQRCRRSWNKRMAMQCMRRGTRPRHQCCQEHPRGRTWPSCRRNPRPSRAQRASRRLMAGRTSKKARHFGGLWLSETEIASPSGRVHALRVTSSAASHGAPAYCPRSAARIAGR